MNFTSQLEPIWMQYSDILERTEYESWFDDVRDAGDVIIALWNTSPATKDNPTSKARENAKMKGYIDDRLKLQKRAEVELENFLLACRHVFKEIIGVSSAWRLYVHASLVSNHDQGLKFMAGHESFFHEPLSMGYEDDLEQQAANKTSYIFNKSARHLLNRMLALHRDFYVTHELRNNLADISYRFPDADDSFSRKKGNKERNLLALSDVISAQELEEKFISSLLEMSPYANLWDDGRNHSTSLEVLTSNIAGLQKELDAIEFKLAILKMRVEADIAHEHSYTQINSFEAGNDDSISVQDLDKLLNNWSTLLDDANEAMSRAEQRFDTLRARILRNYSYQTKKWCNKYCAGTTCFQLTPDRAWARFLGAAQRRLGMSGYREAKRQFAKQPMKEKKVQHNEETDAVAVMEGEDLGRFEKICCGQVEDNQWLGLLKFNAPGLVYLDPSRNSVPIL